MAEYAAGPNLVLTWTWSGGTTSLAADSRSVTWQTSIKKVDISAGADTQTTYMSTLKEGAATINLVDQTGGTAIAAALLAGVSGTLTIGPEGTATGKRKVTLPSFSEGAQYTYPYADIAVISCSFAPNANYTDSVY
jgi:hypothetical protein